MSTTFTVAIVSSPIGDLQAVFSERGLALLDFHEGGHAAEDLAKLRKAYPKAQWQEADLNEPSWQQFTLQMAEYFAGSRQSFDLPLDAFGTAFQKQVWDLLCEIPYGDTWSYGEQARRLGNPKAVRAVAGANAKNPIGIVVPCHRVIGGNGKLVGYGGGLERKEYLLALEKKYRR